MIINHKYKFIFIKTSKTAGTSMELGLHPFCDAGDVVTTITSSAWLLHHNAAERRYRSMFPDYRPGNYYTPLRHYGWRQWARLLMGQRDRLINHSRAIEVMNRIDPEIWQNYFKFCFVRNPWDRVISHYYFHREFVHQPDMTFDEYFIKANMNYLNISGYLSYTFKDVMLVDKVYRFEAIPDSLQDLKQRLGLPQDIVMPRENAHFRKKRAPYQDVLTPKQADIIQEHFAKEIEWFDYRFED